MLIQLAPDRSWRDDGTVIRAALGEALERATEWRTDQSVDGDVSDQQLVTRAREVLDGPVGDVIRSHGGRATIVSVDNGIVTVSLQGACSGCPAVEFTLVTRIERAIRERCPAVRGVRAMEQPRGGLRLFRLTTGASAKKGEQ